MPLGITCRVREKRVNYEARASFYLTVIVNLWKDYWENAIIIRNSPKLETKTVAI